MLNSSSSSFRIDNAKFKADICVPLERTLDSHILNWNLIDVSFPGRDKQFVAQVPLEEQVAWTWCLLFAFCVPELGTLFRSLRICFFKSWRRPPLRDFIFVCSMETLHVVGLASLVFIVLPSLDVVKGAMITNCLCFIPAFLSKYISSQL